MTFWFLNQTIFKLKSSAVAEKPDLVAKSKHVWVGYGLAQQHLGHLRPPHRSTTAPNSTLQRISTNAMDI